jgi:hypothetical protein
MLSPYLAYYFSGIGWTALWVYAWLTVWTIFVRAKWDDATRGLFLIIASSWVAIIGKHYLHENEQVVDAIQNVMLLVGGGVGGNFLYAYLSKKQKARK